MSLGERKRKEITHLVRKSVNKRDLLRLGLEWDTHLYDGALSCGHVILGRHGNVISLYTWTKKRRVDCPLPRFNSVEVSLFDGRYEKLANRVCAGLSRNGYLAEMTKTKEYTARNVPSRVFL